MQAGPRDEIPILSPGSCFSRQFEELGHPCFPEGKHEVATAVVGQCLWRFAPVVLSSRGAPGTGDTGDLGLAFGKLLLTFGVSTIENGVRK